MPIRQASGVMERPLLTRTIAWYVSYTAILIIPILISARSYGRLWPETLRFPVRDLHRPAPVFLPCLLFQRSNLEYDSKIAGLLCGELNEQTLGSARPGKRLPGAE